MARVPCWPCPSGRAAFRPAWPCFPGKPSGSVCQRSNVPDDSDGPTDGSGHGRTGCAGCLAASSVPPHGEPGGEVRASPPWSAGTPEEPAAPSVSGARAPRHRCGRALSPTRGSRDARMPGPPPPPGPVRTRGTAGEPPSTVASQAGEPEGAEDTCSVCPTPLSPLSRF